MQHDAYEWDREEWLHSAKNLIQWASETSPNSRVLLLVRHSHRETIEDHTAQLSTELTQLGCRMSAEMGRRLPSNRKSWFFFSFVTRCYQTADEMSKGLTEKGAVIEDMDALGVLATPEVRDEKFWNALQPDGKNITDFVNRWADGTFGEWVEPFTDYRERLIQDTVARLRESPEGSLHIHITHDLALMAAKRILLGREVETPDREPYLGGIGIIAEENGLILYCSGDIVKLNLS
ncbi:MAG: histidine phosphatase family protein [Candidatus Thorarchaeota archaeon]|jgi:broad specificity phosphatase PhoE